MNLEKLRERALELTVEVRTKIASAQCVFFKDGIGLASAQLDQYDKMLDRMEIKLMLGSINEKCKRGKYIRQEDSTETFEIVMFIEMMEVISRGFDTGEIKTGKAKGFSWI